MKRNYIIGAGGTGAMSIYSFIMLVAAGCVSGEDIYHILLVDKDEKSDAGEKCRELIRKYNLFRREIQLTSEGCERLLHFPEIVLSEWNFTDAVIAKYKEIMDQPALSLQQLGELNLKKLFNSSDDPLILETLHAFYSDEELEADLNQGFYGHPNIGCAVFRYVKKEFTEGTFLDRNGNVHNNEFMQSLRDDLKNGSGLIGVYIMGSVFGGTGASIFPNVVDALRDIQVEDEGNRTEPGRFMIYLGGSLVMPYFRLPKPVREVSGIHPESGKFEQQAQEALRFYGSTDSTITENMDHLFLVGTSELAITSEVYAKGEKQYQHFHYVLLYAALAACNFFNRKKEKRNTGKVVPSVWGVNMKSDPKTLRVVDVMALEGEGCNYRELMESFLRFGSVVYYMKERYDQSDEKLCELPEVLATSEKKLRKKGRNILLDNQEAVRIAYKEAVNNAVEFCRSYLEFYQDIALSGFSWNGFHEVDKNGSLDESKCIRGELLKGREKRQVDMVSLDTLYRYLYEQVDPNSESINALLAYTPLGKEEKEAVTFEECTIGGPYYDAVQELGMVYRLFKALGPVKEDACFGDLYQKIYQKCVTNNKKV